MSEVNGAKWKHPRDNQIKVEGWRQTEIARRWPLPKKIDRQYGELPLDQVSDDDRKVERTFEHTCELVRAVTLTGPQKSRMLLYFDGYDIEEVPVGKVHLEFFDHIVAPRASIRFSGFGARRGTLNNYEVQNITLSFKDREQLKEYVTEQSVAAKAAKIPSSITVYKDDD